MAGCVVVTGGGSGIGRAVAVDQAARGMEVVVVGRREAALEGTVAAAAEGRVRPVVADVATVDGVAAVVAAAGESVVGLVAAAGGQGSFKDVGAGLDAVLQAWEAALSVNLLTTVLTAEGLAPHLQDQRGRVVLVSSTSAMDGLGGPYATAKAAVNGYGRDLARRLGPRGVTVNVLAPGFTADTDFFSSAHLTLDDSVVRQAAARTLVGRVGTSADMAAATAWLLSEDSGFLTGQVVSPNGGQVLVR